MSLVLAVLATTGLVARAPSSPADISNKVRYLGRLPLPADWLSTDAPAILQVDAEKRRIISVYSSQKTGLDHILEYDLRSPLPRIARVRAPGAGFRRNLPSPYINVIDSKRDRLLSLIAQGGAGSAVQVLDLKDLTVGASWDLNTRVPGFVGWGLTYSEQDDVVYVVGEIIGIYNAQNGFLFPGGVKPPISAVVLALRPDDGSLIWGISIPHCQPLNTRSVGALIARSRLYSALYLPCARNFAYPNLAGIVRITIRPGSVQADATTFPQEFFPISGVWTENGPIRGIAAFDPPTDRLLMQSLSLSTPGAWVFDGSISGWVGFIASPAQYDAIGVNEGSGHFYATTLGREMLISSVRGTPVSQGDTAEAVKAGANGVFVYTDAGSNRFFLSLPTPQKDGDSVLTYGVFADQTTDEIPLPPTDYDALTVDLPESPDVIATYAGSVRGFGSRVSVVGGGGGAWEGLRQLIGGTALPSWPLSGVSPGDRSFALASIPSIDLRNAGAGSSAQAVAPDINTDDESRTKQTQVRETDPQLEPVAKAIAWPWSPLACLDGEGHRIEQSTQAGSGQGTARISCDVEARIAEANATSPGLRIGAGASISIGSSTSEARAIRGAKGIETTITSVTKGLEVSAPGLGTFSIGEAISVAQATAHGRIGTADVSLQRTFKRLVVRDADGMIVREVKECDVESDRCQSAVALANSLLAPRFRFYVPAAELRKTPGGAFAGVQKADAEYLNALNTQNDNSRVLPAIELIAYNDTAEKSRLVVQAAGVQVNSIYYLQPSGSAEKDTEIIREIVQVPVQQIVNVEVPGPQRIITRVVRRPGGLPARLGGALAVMTRSPKEALHLALIWVLMGGSIAALLRRRALRRSMDH